MSTKEVNQSQKKPESTPANPQPAQSDRIQNLLAKAGNTNVEVILKKVQPAIDFLKNMFHIVAPFIHLYGEKAYNFYNSLPLDVIYALIGLFIAFFGGIYCVFLAAAETFYSTGFKDMQKLWIKVNSEMVNLWEANEKDDKIDADNSGKADILELTLSQLATRKFMLFLRACRDPDTIMSIIPSLITAYISGII